ncbi:MAG TPA: O-methyltransferase [Terriglobales bacterium]|jgi:predicted O-methyltransferase YrrM|nr:O-methyltransferase [Terriglobales bacterium]
MNPITAESVENYLYAILPQRDEVLREMEAQAKQRDIPIIGPMVASFLYQLAQIAKAQTVFELGSAIGYSTIWWARAVGPNGRVVYTDSSQKNADEARRYFERAGVAARIDVRLGDALEILSEEKPGSYDIIFNDVDKEDYPRVLPLATERLRKGGLLITDNVLWSGYVADPNAKDDSTRAIQEFNRLLYASPDFFTTIVPMRDGVAIAQRK